MTILSRNVVDFRIVA